MEPDEIQTTAWEAGADWWWTATYAAHTARIEWGEVTISKGYQGVRLSRIVEESYGLFRQVNRYVKPDFPITLKKIRK